METQSIQTAVISSDEDMNKTCICGEQMKKVEKETPEVKGVTFPAYTCSSCGRIRYIETNITMFSKLVGLEPVKKRVFKSNTNLAVILPKAFTDALKMQEHQEVEIAVEGINKLVIRKI